MNTSSLAYNNIDHDWLEKMTPFIVKDQCMVSGEAEVRMEKVPENSRRIFAGTDITSSVNDVLNVSHSLGIMNPCLFMLILY